MVTVRPFITPYYICGWATYIWCWATSKLPLGAHRRHHSTHKYHLANPFFRATCGPSVCGIYFNTNHTNFSNCVGVNLQQGNNSIRVKRNTNRIASYLEVLPRAISKIRKIRVKRNTNRMASHLEVLPRAISKIRKIRV